MKTKTEEFLEKAESFYNDLNHWLGQGKTGLLDELFPNHDGVADDEVGATLYALRDRLYSISGGINELAMPELCGDIELLEKADEQ